MRKVHLVKQVSEKDCGAASLAMILSSYGKKIPIASVREAIKVDQYGASIYGLVDGAESYQLTAKVYDNTADAVWTAVESDQESLPAIIRIINRVGLEHYVVVSKVKNGKLEVYDPGLGKMKMEREAFNECFLGQIIVFAPNSSFKKENRKKGQFTKFSSMILKQKKLLVYIAVLSLFVTAVGIAGSYVFQYIIDAGLNEISHTNNRMPWFRSFLILVIGLAVMYIFKAVVQILRGKLLTIMSKNIDIHLMLGYYNHVTELPMNFFETRKNGEISSRFSDAAKIRDALSNATLTLMIDFVMVIVCGMVLYKESIVLFLISLIIFAIYILVSVVYVHPLDKMNREVMENNAQFSSYLKETIDGMETVKASQAELIVKNRMRELFEKYMDSNIRGALISLGKDTIVETVTSIGNLVILCVGVFSILSGNMTTGTLVTFNMMLAYFLSPVQNIVELQNNIQTAIVAADRLNDILDIATENKEGVPIGETIKRVSLEHVNFRYGNRDLVLKDISIEINSGEYIALVGESGCGKSTITKLIMGMHQPEKGQICINDKQMKDIALSDVRSRIAFVPQTNWLLSGSIRENLLFGHEHPEQVSEKEIMQVLEACCCDFVKDMPFGIDSMLEENGVNLSGGQKQKITIARALLRYPEILILDEATSALDALAECKIQKAFQEIVPTATIIMVAHRLSTVKNCSKIFVLDKGAIIESGSHRELLEKKGRYAELWQHQTCEQMM